VNVTVEVVVGLAVPVEVGLKVSVAVAARDENGRQAASSMMNRPAISSNFLNPIPISDLSEGKMRF
jgi:hypothetical protein